MVMGEMAEPPDGIGVNKSINYLTGGAVVMLYPG